MSTVKLHFVKQISSQQAPEFQGSYLFKAESYVPMHPGFDSFETDPKSMLAPLEDHRRNFTFQIIDMEIQKKSTEDYSNKGTKEDDIKKKSFPPPPQKKV